ncbi:MAG: hypothetical protein CO060_00420 [Candidatus Yonathbacteria bacterium CG_4_9_14_0_2_um_filter_43_16]|uniref:Uncharacterized protein n=1 Tax=Candidatus Yonathbacteria bacterium CG_4_10_14_0_8_um_filter_43_17 TaxID=1975099 RepID=A0A2M7Q3Q9_9BACT|nr:MAG: hypothetical protein COZ48_01290 [Candidatus Yonathbacteria bacterium CG_4_10_14_3_um_filter_43_12]PIY58061.1 MAG: hypothetical protein COY98_04125 [Candidatus Yonathbacteria bacterium CG_4_10_14_0_8_um_filter_43_17]PJC22466.1 MAG: hypothetical protein CO060_00420 [Candidatus Yonathbacteria bacterium CG_4_9_14_0_2_um_filter_43_16]
MKRIHIFLFVLYIIFVFGAWFIFSENTSEKATLVSEITNLKTELANTKNDLDAERSLRVILEEKISGSRVNASFLALALCPTLEATNNEAFCIKNSTEWLSQTIISGIALTDPEAKAKMETLLVALGKKTKPTAKQLYEMLRPIEIDSLKALTKNLK